MRYIIDTTKRFTGSVENTMNEEEDIVHYTGTEVRETIENPDGTITNITNFQNPQTFAEYNAENGGNLKVLTWPEMETLIKDTIKNESFQWCEITEEKFDFYLDCIPPKKMFKKCFIGGEPLFLNLYTVCAKHDNKYFSCIAPVTATEAEILESIKTAHSINDILYL